MKMVKSLLLGSAAGVVAVAGAQAADLPVKAKPVQYVKICTLYGDGFYYIPGSDTCIRFAGYIRADYGCNGRRPHVHDRRRRRAGPHRAAGTRPGTAPTSASTRARRLPTARCGRIMNVNFENENAARITPRQLVRSSSGRASPSAVRRRSPTTKAASATPACAR